jgi:asparagine synthase (glutamine-hydrolysing)
MAAIAGIVGSDASRDRVESMLDTMKHRGPDARDLHQADGILAGIGAADLSPARGTGFATADGVTVLVDGDIYNDREAGQSDADVVLALYRQHGMAFAGHLEGVFGVAVIDGADVLLARDGVGVRPVYRGVTAGGGICFASEMKALVGVTEDAAELLPGTTFSTARGVAGYVPRLPVVALPDEWPEAARALRSCLTGAVQRRIEDGAVGACLLSGGLDSSIIACAAKELGADIPLLTVGYEGGAPDVDNAKIVAEHLGMRHEIRLFTANEIEELVPRAVGTMESFDEDCVSGTIANLFASELASRTTNSILSGEGGDELFGGYHLLKDVPTESGRLLMMKRLVEVAYNTAVQRLDRSMMANNIHYRTPFIDAEVMAFAAHLPVDWKIRRTSSGELTEKWLLREAFKDLLPDAIYRRRKLRFSGGTGTDDVMDRIARTHLRDDEFTEASRNTAEGYVLNSPKELWYYRLFKDQFPAPCFERLVGRWDPGK